MNQIHKPNPGKVIVPPEIVQPSPTILIQTASAPHQERLHSTGWFARSFAASAGVAIVVVVFLLLIASPFIIAAWKTTSAIQTTVKQAVNKQANDAATASKVLLPAVKKHGIVQLAKDASLDRDGNFARFAATGKKHNGKLVQITAAFTIAQFGSEVSWQVEELRIDGKRVNAIFDE